MKNVQDRAMFSALGLFLQTTSGLHFFPNSFASYSNIYSDSLYKRSRLLSILEGRTFSHCLTSFNNTSFILIQHSSNKYCRNFYLRVYYQRFFKPAIFSVQGCLEKTNGKEEGSEIKISVLPSTVLPRTYEISFN